MPRVLVIHGAGMNMRGKVPVDIFGPMTLPEYDERIRGYAKELGVEIEILHSNIEGELVNRLYAANDQGFDAAIFNPAAFGTGYPALVVAISQVKSPTVEVHISNPIRQPTSTRSSTTRHGSRSGKPSRTTASFSRGTSRCSSASRAIVPSAKQRASSRTFS